MEDPRLSRMYAKLFTRHLRKRHEGFWSWVRENRSSMLNLAAVLVVIVFAIGYMAHRHGKFRRLKTEIAARRSPVVEAPPLLGGQEAVVVQRTRLAEGTTPEFVSATLLPGRGMNIFQIMMSIPGKGVVPLLEEKSIEAAQGMMSGVGGDRDGAASLQIGSAIQAPWAGFLAGSRESNGQTMATTWDGRNLMLPMNGGSGDVGLSQGGLLLKSEADALHRNTLPDGESVQGSFAASNFGGRWPSETSVVATALLSSRTFELKLVARNEGKEPTPVGLGWMPRLLMPGGSRMGLRLRLPAEAREEIKGGRATGKLIPVAGTAMDFSERTGKSLRDLDLDETFTNLKAGFLDNGPIVEIRDVRSGVGLRMTAMSPQIRAIHVRAAVGDDRVAIGFQTNYDDPFSRVWTRDDTPVINVLQPGQTLQWRVRLELYALPDDNPSSF